MNTYKDLVKLVEKSVKNFRSDFKIDEDIINNNPGLPFIHITRDNGTSLNLFHKLESFTEGKEMKQLNNLKIGFYWYVNNVKPNKITFFDGVKLKSIRKQTAIDKFSAYYRSIIFQYQDQQLEILNNQS